MRHTAPHGARPRAIFARGARDHRSRPGGGRAGKLFCNAWRYATFAIANQFQSLCAAKGIDYAQVQADITKSCSRMRGLFTAGLAAGPCLFKHTMQLSAYYNNDFSLGQSATLVNEGVLRVLVNQLKPLGLVDKTVGVLGMAFNGDDGDTRESRSR